MKFDKSMLWGLLGIFGGTCLGFSIGYNHGINNAETVYTQKMKDLQKKDINDCMKVLEATIDTCQDMLNQKREEQSL